jgi:BASS family bile acid:Na+ symporter
MLSGGVMGAGIMGMSLLKNSSFVLLLSILFGLIWPGPAQSTEMLITPVLMIMMAFSLTDVNLSATLGQVSLKSSMLGLALNYGLLSGLILLLSHSLQDEALRQGFIVMAAVPPAVAILPMTRILNGDMPLSLHSEAISYLSSLVLMPAIIYAFTREMGINPIFLVQISLLLILLPALSSRIVRRISIDPVLPINLGFFLVTYTVIGLNQDALWGDLGFVSWIALARTLGIGLAIYIASRLAGSDRSHAISYTLLGSYKNLGLAAAVSLMLFGPEAGVPAAICVLAETGFFILLAITKPR